jgi:hypothetical protein
LQWEPCPEQPLHIDYRKAALIKLSSQNAQFPPTYCKCVWWFTSRALKMEATKPYFCFWRCYWMEARMK